MIKEVDGKTYRLNVGIAVMNMDGNFFVGRRTDCSFDSHRFWQMPQGGQDKNETIEETAIRELYEETGITSVKILKISNWMYYDYPPEVRKKRQQDGQMQKWVLVLFTGDDDEINLNIDKEFCEYKWDNPENIINNIVSFRKDVYTKLFNEFSDFIKK